MTLDKIIILITGICLLINAISDWINRESYTITFFISYILIFLLTKDPRIFIFILVTLFFSNDNEIMGGGDIDAGLLSLYTLGMSGFIPQLLIACILGILYRLLSLDEKIPFITMLCIGYCITSFKLII